MLKMDKIVMKKKIPKIGFFFVNIALFFQNVEKKQRDEKEHWSWSRSRKSPFHTP